MRKQITIIWTIFDCLYLASAVVCFVFAGVWRGFGAADPANNDMALRRFVVSEENNLAAVALACWITLSFVVSAPAALHTRKPGTKSTWLNAFTITVLMSTMATIAIGTCVWFYTLQVQIEYEGVWTAASPAMHIFLQDTLHCCGYYNATLPGLFAESSGFCATPSVNLTTVQGCMAPIQQYADNTLNNIFSTVYGFVVIESGLFLATCCLRVLKREDERALKIDRKSGVKGGFV